MRDLSRVLRANMTPAERKLWRQLKSKQLGAFFHRQRVIGRYICDFVTLDPPLVVEVDGSQHYTEKMMLEDKERDRYLRDLGFKVLRFPNRYVMNNLEGVLTVIMDHLR
ncbi:MAG: endonuclease domain-containing protein [Calditrichaeota bacterium]|nr:endonuclease domain-containing protein [Calditrichota bacterium]